MHVYDSVRRWIQQAGGDVYLIVPVQNVDYLRTSNSKIPKMTLEEEKKMENVLDMCDGLFLPGGSKFTEYDRFILDYAIKKDIPTLGVCLSMQMMSCYKEEINLVKNDSTINHYQRDEDIFCHSILIN